MTSTLFDPLAWCEAIATAMLLALHQALPFARKFQFARRKGGESGTL